MIYETSFVDAQKHIQIETMPKRKNLIIFLLGIT